MVQCHLCQAWFHYPCINEKEADIVGIWSCQVCRSLGRTVSGITDKLSSLESTIRLLQENNTHLSRLVTDQVKTADELRQENGALRVQGQNLLDELAATTNQADISTRLDNIADQLAGSTISHRGRKYPLSPPR